MAEISWKEVSSLPGFIIYNEITTVSRNGKTPESELVRFVLNTTPDENSLLEARVLDKNWNLLTEKKMFFKGIDEFFALTKYLVRNGFNTTIA